MLTHEICKIMKTWHSNLRGRDELHKNYGLATWLEETAQETLKRRCEDNIKLYP